MRSGLALTGRRTLAFAVDWLVVASWGGVLFGVVMLATGGDPPRPSGPWSAQAIGLLTMTVPVTLYFALCECSASRASLGKRLLALVVSTETGDRLSFGAALSRNALKFLPWEFGHTVAQQAAFSGEGGFATWVWGPAVIAVAGPTWWLAAMIAKGRTPYDRWASALVGVSSDPRQRFGTGASAAR